MRIHCEWGDQMKFIARDEQFTVKMDAQRPLGESSAMTPKQYLLASICGCTAMDVIALMKKQKQKVNQFEVVADAKLTHGSYPVIFERILLHFKLSGQIEQEQLIEAVRLSQTQYCGVSAMVSKAVQIFYTIELNGVKIGEGQSHFNF